MKQVLMERLIGSIVEVHGNKVNIVKIEKIVTPSGSNTRAFRGQILYCSDKDFEIAVATFCS